MFPFLSYFSLFIDQMMNMPIIIHILVWIVLLLLLCWLYKWIQLQKKKKEGFQSQFKQSEYQQKEPFLTKEGKDVYDSFYSHIYDQLVYNSQLVDYEVNATLKAGNPSLILDIGSGTGHVVKKLSDALSSSSTSTNPSSISNPSSTSTSSSSSIKIIGLDLSQDMINKAKEYYPTLTFQQGNALNDKLFSSNTFSHITCFYFTIYYMKDKETFFHNCMKWLQPGGHLLIHMVDRQMFDPIIPPSNPLLILTPQRYAKKRITQSKVVFDQFDYQSNFDVQDTKNTATFTEKFYNRDGTVRKNEHQMWMPTEDSMIDMAESIGFELETEINLIQVGYEYNKLVILVKPIKSKTISSKQSMLKTN